MADRVHALRTGRSPGRSLRPPPVSGPSSQSKGKQPIRPNPQFEAYHNPWRLPESDPDDGFWSWLFTPPSKPSSLPSSSPSVVSAAQGKGKNSMGYDGYGVYAAYGGYDDEDDVPEAKGAARWLKPLALLFTVALLITFVALVPPPSYESRGPRPNSTLIVQSSDSDVPSDFVRELAEEHPDVEQPGDAEAQRVFRIVHQSR
ncbi:hypothetical protein A1Q2_00487 [Trichosporon asahii var. asahii CBS 8904]|uniref:Uncharacterized protein n=1 Tax=Trichosporon asahii var. asahii (strain CBS 8904) TaxID=1220162 RepID=K1W0C5_TRIAC|nr:hypothetical protein A1Q2_00487 [Trichosporon asahii var. asahii CBS 8904]